MPDPKKDQKEMDWADREPPEEPDDGSEPTYRDGSAVNECWAKDAEGY